MDPKTWLFALFAALIDVPNSLTNQRQIIVTEFGFTTLQTTLLGCVDGLVEILTIITGVNVGDFSSLIFAQSKIADVLDCFTHPKL